ncbi:hypothetical protein ES703_45739 [subsurface metagenome]
MTSRRKTGWVNAPEPETQKILNTALAHINSVPYSVSLRWVFYRLYQDGFYKTKKGYDNFEQICSRARHSGWGGWRPDTLADETREIIVRTYGLPSIEEALEKMPDDLALSIDLSVDHFYHQKTYCELWYEARAMTGQFRHHTAKIDLIPMGGQPSIPYKWKIAKRLEQKNLIYEKPIKILYFGDEDLAGHRIKADIEEDTKKWCEIPFEIKWCGLTEKQAEKYGIPHSYEKKGYQWEALSDEAAAEIIESSITEYIDSKIIEEAERKRAEQEEYWGEIIREAVEDAVKKNI